MLSRWYSIFLGIMLLIIGVVGFLAPNFLGAANMGAWTPTIWVITALVSLVLGFTLRNVNSLRWWAGIIGALYVVWGVVGLFSSSLRPTLDLRDLLSTFMVLFGSLGLAAALAPAYWLREHETYAPGRA